MLVTLPRKKTLAEEIQRLMDEEFDGSPTRLAEAAGVDRSAVYEWLKGGMPQTKNRKWLIARGIDPIRFVRPDTQKRLTELERQIQAGLREIQAIREQLEPGSGR